MKQIFKLLLSPMAFAIGFLWPLSIQSLVALGWASAGWQAILIGAAIAMPFGVLAQMRGSWLWIK